LLGDSDQPYLACPESLEQCKLLRRLATQAVHAYHYDGVGCWPAGVEQVGDVPAATALGQQLGTGNAFISDDLDSLGTNPLSQRPDTRLVRLQRHALCRLFLRRHSRVTHDSYASIVNARSSRNVR
jgi:hypothetical protein